MSIKITQGRKKLKPAHFICAVDNPLPFISELSVSMSSNYEAIAKMLAGAMEQENTIASVLIMAIAEYNIETNVDTLRLLNESISDLRKLKAAAEAGTEGDEVRFKNFTDMIKEVIEKSSFANPKKSNQV